MSSVHLRGEPAQAPSDTPAGRRPWRRQADRPRSTLRKEAERRDLFKMPLTPAELDHFDAVVFDPPRQGARAQAHALAQSSVPLVVAVSCNPGTFARDIRQLIDGGYRVLSVMPVDQFRYSAHVETVAQLAK